MLYTRQDTNLSHRQQLSETGFKSSSQLLIYVIIIKDRSWCKPVHSRETV